MAAGDATVRAQLLFYGSMVLVRLWRRWCMLSVFEARMFLSYLLESYQGVFGEQEVGGSVRAGAGLGGGVGEGLGEKSSCEGDHRLYHGP